MQIATFENLILSELKKVVESIIAKHPTLPIAVKQGERQGDAISKFLENAFVVRTATHPYFNQSQASPIGKTKNPYDVATFFRYNDHNELIWIDFKAVNIDNDDSNPDSGTPDKVITLITSGSFYLVYVFVFYKGTNADLSFMEKDGELVKTYFLKDISPTVRITPANQLQVNYAQPPQYRTRVEFINFLIEKKQQSFERRLKKAQLALEALEKGIVHQQITLNDLIEGNQKQEDIIKNL
jgi:hypothetical protein